MKKVIVILATAAVALAIASCAKEQFAEVSSNTDQLSYPTKTIVFKTDFTKTTLDGTQPMWEEGDTVKILWIQAEIDTTTQEEVYVPKNVLAPVTKSGSDWEIAAEVGEARDYYYAVYPGSATVTLKPFVENGYGDSLSVKIPNLCDGTFANAQYAVATASADIPEFSFKTVNNIVKFNISSSDIAKVEFRSTDEGNVAGTMTIPFEYDMIGTAEQTASGAKMQVTVSGPGVYYAPLIGNIEIGGLAVAEYNADDEQIACRIGSSPMAGTGIVYNLGTLDEAKYEPHDFFFKLDGRGTGTSWDDAMGVDDFKRLFSTYVGGWMVNGCNLYFAEGEYDLNMGKTGSAGILTMQSNYPVVTNIYGGYSESSTGTDLTQRNPETTPTVFTNKAADKYGRVLYWNGFSGDQLYDGITFKVQDNNNYRGCLYSNASNKGKLTFNNCTWKDANVAVYGAVGQFASMDVFFTNCTIKDNVSTYVNSKAGTNTNGGAVLVSNYCKATFDNCVFKNNKISAPGSAILVASGTAVIKNCLFEGNATTASSKVTFSKTGNSSQAGTVAIVSYATDFNSGDAKSNPTAKVYIDNCVFKGNTSATCAADIYAYNNIANSKPLLYINRTCFSGSRSNGSKDALCGEKNYNGAYQPKGVFAESSSKVNAQVQLCINNCTFTDVKGNTYDTVPCVGTTNTDWTMVNTSVVTTGVATLRNNASLEADRLSCFNMMNCAISHPSGSNGINLSNSTAYVNCGYNIMCNTKNAYTLGATQDPETLKWTAGSVTKPNPETDGYVVYADMNWDLTSHIDQKYITFEITPGKENDSDRPVQYANIEAVQEWATKNCPDFDAWLKTIHTDVSPYAIDIRGEQRNPEKLQKGSWDPGL